MMKTYTLEEFKDEQKQQPFRFLALYTQDGRKIVSFNPPSTSAEERLEQIEKTLSSTAVSDGFYQIRCKDSQYNDVEPVTYMIKKGNPKIDKDPTPAPTPPPEPEPTPTLSDHGGFTYTDALKLQREIMMLKNENNLLQRDLDTAQDVIDSQQELIEELKQGVMNEALEESPNEIGEYIRGVAEAFKPLAQQYLDNEADKIDLERDRLELEQYKQVRYDQKDGHKIPSWAQNPVNPTDVAPDRNFEQTFFSEGQPLTPEQMAEFGLNPDAQ